MDPALVKLLETALAKVNQDPKVLELYDRYFQPVIWMDSAEYSRYAARTFAHVRATIERLVRSYGDPNTDTDGNANGYSYGYSDGDSN